MTYPMTVPEVLCYRFVNSDFVSLEHLEFWDDDSGHCAMLWYSREAPVCKWVFKNTGEIGLCTETYTCLFLDGIHLKYA